MLARILERAAHTQGAKGPAPWAPSRSRARAPSTLRPREDGSTHGSRYKLQHLCAALLAAASCCSASAATATWLAAAAVGAALAAPPKATPTGVAGGQAGRRNPRRERAQRAAPVAVAVCTHPTAEAGRLQTAMCLAVSSHAAAHG